MGLLTRLRAMLWPKNVEKAYNSLTGGIFQNGDPVLSRLILEAYGSGDAAMQDPAISGIVRLISGTVAKLPLLAYVLRGDERERDRNHWLERLMRRPNSWQTGFEFRRQLTAHVVLHGNGYALKRISGATIEELIPWHPSKVTVRQDDPFDPPTYELSGRDGQRLYQASDMLHLRDLTLDGVTGGSRTDEAQQGLLISRAAETFAMARLMNGSDPGVILSTDKSLTPEQRKAIADGWKASHQGPSRSNLPAVVEGGMKVERSLTSTNKDSQFMELRSFQIEDHARRNGVPPHLIGLTEKQSSWGTGIEQMTIGFRTFTISDYTEMWETAAKRDLLVSPADEKVFMEHLFEGLLRTDFKTQAEAFAILLQNEVVNSNWVRRKMNEPPRPGGEVYRNPNINPTPAATETPSDDAPAQFPGDRPKAAWRKKIRAAKRVIGSREVA